MGYRSAEYANFASKQIVMAKNLRILLNTSEITAGTRGSSLGPLAVITAARAKQDSFFFDNPPIHLPNENHYLDKASKYIWSKNIDGFEKVCDHVMNAMADSFAHGQFPFVLSGDHGSAAGTIAAIKNQFPKERVGVVWIDAHGDLHTPYTTPSGNMHGMPLAIALNEDNLPCQKNELDDETRQIWERLKKLGGTGAKIDSKDLVFIAVRDTEAEEEDLMARHQIKNYTVQELREKKWSSVKTELQKWIAELDVLYVSFDVDSMDPDLTSYGTGTPVKNGLTVAEAQEMLHFFAEQKKLCCLEIVEVNPCLDNKVNTMAEITFDLMKSTIEIIKKN